MKLSDTIRYRIASPLATHRRRATCQEVDCQAWRFGWSSRVDTTTPRGKAVVEYIRSGSGRAFRETQEDANTIRFDFSPGQRCFASDSHTVAVRPETYLVQEGASSEVIRMHTRPVDWVEDLGLHQEAIAERMRAERG